MSRVLGGNAIFIYCIPSIVLYCVAWFFENEYKYCLLLNHDHSSDSTNQLQGRGAVNIGQTSSALKNIVMSSLNQSRMLFCTLNTTYM